LRLGNIINVSGIYNIYRLKCTKLGSYKEVAEHLTPPLLQLGIKEVVLLDPELGQRVAKSLVAEHIEQVIRGQLAKDVLAAPHAA
jgi:hypothetical protein